MTMARRIVFVLTALAAIPTSSNAQANGDYARRFAALATAPSLTDSARFHQLLDLDWEYTNVTFPEYATYTGYPGQNDRWTDLSLPAIRAQRALVRTELSAVRAINRAQLNPADQLSYDILKRGFEEALEGQRFPGDLMPVDQRNGPQYLASTLESSPQATVRDYEN